MENSTTTLPPEYWTEFKPTKTDIDFISNYLFEKEAPLTEKEIVPILVEERIAFERKELVKKQKGGCKTYLPKETYKTGDNLTFPALGWKKGIVESTREGINPSIGAFGVIEVKFEDGTTRKFATSLEVHGLNEAPEVLNEDESLNASLIIANHSRIIETAIAKELREDENLVQVAGRWFPRALLVNINVGHLNLAEAILDEAAGKPLPPEVLLEQVGLPGNDNSNLEAFSLNYALQEDGRFDEVGPAGEVLWCLKRLEPTDVQIIPQPLRYIDVSYDRAAMTKDMLALETLIDDELGESEAPAKTEDEVTISLTYPHWRAGTLPISARTKQLFPTAYESERVRFIVVDETSKEEIPAWVVRKARYVAGMKNFYQKYGLIPGSLIKLRRGNKSGQVMIEARTKRPMRDWVRTVLVGSDGGLVFANLKQNLTTEFNDRMVVAVPDPVGVDVACEKIQKQKIPFEKLVAGMMQELTKLNVQGHVHAQELYAALNIVRRCPAGPLLVHLTQAQEYKHVGDQHYRIVEVENSDE